MAKSSTERSRLRRERMQRTDATEPQNATKTDATVSDATVDATKCRHRDIEPSVSRTGKHLSYTKAGPSLADRQPDVIELKAVVCPCCGWRFTLR